ncbi:MAG: hypothetical protein KBD64_02945 [Gammaproteobacteria bacterium]|nr:hypothetical protein [Gammaproteobacteria bacterium]
MLKFIRLYKLLIAIGQFGFFCYTCSNIFANPLDVFTTKIDKNKIFYCNDGVYQPENVKPLKTGPGTIDYCDKVRLNIKHYNTADNQLSTTCPSKSVYRIITKVSPVGQDGRCNAAEIKWYCDSFDTGVFSAVFNTDAKLPKNSMYCPEELYDNTLEILRCPDNKVFSDVKLRANRIDVTRTYCNIVNVGEKHYVEKDQKYARYTSDEIASMREMGDVDASLLKTCASRSAYRLITKKDLVDPNGNCRVTYDVYCDTEVFDKMPFDNKLCPLLPIKTAAVATAQTDTGCCGCGGCCGGGCSSASGVGAVSTQVPMAIYGNRIIERNGMRYEYDVYTGYYLPIQ